MVFANKAKKGMHFDWLTKKKAQNSKFGIILYAKNKKKIVHESDVSNVKKKSRVANSFRLIFYFFDEHLN